jgi:hypothetical protein
VGAAFDSHTGAKDHELINHRIAPDDRILREIDSFGRAKRHAVFQRLGAHAGLKIGFGLCQFLPGIDAQASRPRDR